MSTVTLEVDSPTRSARATRRAAKRAANATAVARQVRRQADKIRRAKLMALVETAMVDLEMEAAKRGLRMPTRLCRNPQTGLTRYHQVATEDLPARAKELRRLVGHVQRFKAFPEEQPRWRTAPNNTVRPRPAFAAGSVSTVPPVVEAIDPTNDSVPASVPAVLDPVALLREAFNIRLERARSSTAQYTQRPEVVAALAEVPTDRDAMLALIKKLEVWQRVPAGDRWAEKQI